MTPFCGRGDCTHSDIPHLTGECRTATPCVNRGPISMGDGHKFSARAELHQIGEQAPYFSVQGEETYRGRIEACGCMHDDVARHFPDLAPVIRVHLADRQGVPMHAAANALYWFGYSTWGKGGAGRPMAPDNDYGRRELETDARGLVWAPAIAANHLRISVDRVRELRERITNAERLPFTNETVAAIRARVMGDICAELAPEWQAEADAAYAVLTNR